VWYNLVATNRALVTFFCWRKGNCHHHYFQVETQGETCPYCNPDFSKLLGVLGRACSGVRRL
jgi:hypothetical protein